MTTKLPTEIIEHIIYFAGIETACILKNSYISQKIAHDNKYTWEYILYNFNYTTIKYLYDIKYNLDELIQFNKEFIPSVYSDIFNNAIKTNDLDKIKLIDKILPNSVVDKDGKLLSETFPLINNWVLLNRPVLFIHFFTKYPKCLKINPETIKKMPIDIQKAYKNTKCTCLKCGGDGIGYKN